MNDTNRNRADLTRRWSLAPFDALFENVTSSFKKLPRSAYTTAGTFPVIDQGVEEIGGFTDDPELVHPGPVPAIVFGDHTRAVKFATRPFVQGADGVKVLAPRPPALPKFAYWSLRAAEIPDKGYARHFSLLRKVSFPLPPLPEQHRIVEAIESYFTRLDDAVATLERVQRNLKRYRASVLKAAVEGRLVPHAAFAETEWKPIGYSIQALDQGWSPRCERHASKDLETWGVIKTTAVQPLAFVDRENKQLPGNLKPRPHLELRPGDLLVTRAGPRSRVAISCLVRATRPRLMICDKVYRIRTKDDVATPGFLEITLNAPPVLDQLEELKSGISDSGLNLTQERFAEVRVPLPPIELQVEVERDVQLELSVCESLDEACRVNLVRAARLRQSILKWAFEGKLADQDPNDEPASVLLERIKAEREVGEATKMGGRIGRKKTRAA